MNTDALTPHQQRQVEQALERWTDLHDDCDCGPCVLLRPPVFRSVEPEASFVIKGRGTIYAIKAEPDPLFHVGEHVLMDGAEYEVRGIERFAVAPAPGRPCGLLLKPVTG